MATGFISNEGKSPPVLACDTILVYKPPHNAKLKGVSKIADNDAKAVRVTDNAALPFARAEMKLEILPPGQAATKIIPNAIVGVM